MNPSSNTPENAENLVEVDRAREFALFELLPREFKELIESLPVNQQIEEVYMVWKMYGHKEGLRLIREVFRAKFPEWTGAVEAIHTHRGRRGRLK